MKKTKKINIEQQNTERGYGLLSMMAMIIGIVIGSGIFVKNTGLIAISGDITDVIWAWIIASMLVITMAIAFIEIISVTEITGEQSTLTNWGRRLVGIRFGKFVGYYITLAYFPMIMAALFSFASNQMIGTLITSGWINSDGWTAVEMTFAIVLIATTFLVVIGITNSLSSKPGKYFQNIGTCIKTIPLFFIVGIFLFIVMTNTGNIDFSQDKLDEFINDPNTGEIQDSMYSGIGHLPLILMTLPSILFAFDGFLLAGALSKEAKKPTTFKLSFILSVIFIIVIYILFSVATIGIGDPYTTYSDGTFVKFGSIDNVIYTVFELSAAKILTPIISFFVLISILTGVSGCFISSTRMLSDMAATNTIENKNMDYIQKNKYGVSTHSGFSIMAIIAAWIYIVIIFDTIVSATTGLTMQITIYMSDLVVIGAFFIYGSIIAGAIANRFKPVEKQINVNKNKFFLPAAFTAVIGIFAITVYFAFTVLTPFGAIMGSDNWNLNSLDPVKLENAQNNWFIYWMKLLFTIIFIVNLASITIYNIIKTEKMSSELLSKKGKQILVYYGEEKNDSTDDISFVELQKEDEMLFKRKKNKEIKKIPNKEIKKIPNKEIKQTLTDTTKTKDWEPIPIADLTKAQKETKSNNRGLFMELKKEAIGKGSTLTKIDIEKVLKEREVKVQYKAVGEITNREGISNVKL